MRHSVIALAFAGCLAASLPAFAQPFPSKAVRLIVAYAPGGTGDVVARVIADKLGAALGQTVVVENRAGASGAIGAQSVVGAAPDGHTLLVGQTAEIVVNQYWIKGLDLRSEGPHAGRARDRRAARAHGARQGATREPGRDAQGDRGIGQTARVRFRRHRHARAFRRRVSERKAARQARPCALQGRGARAERHHRRACRHVFFRPPGSNAAAQGRQREDPCGVVGRARAGRTRDPDRRGGDRLRGFRFHALAGLLRPERHAAGR